MSPLALFSLEGRKALVTGASRGIGQALAAALAGAGADVAVTARDAASLEETVAAIEALGRRAVPVAQDVRDVAGSRLAVETAADALGGLDILVNNAGVIGSSGALDTTEEEWDRVITVNLKGVFFCSQGALRHLVPARRGKIVNVASIAGKRGGGILGTVVYAASKAGVIGLTKALAREAAPFGINVNAVCPGITITDMTRDLYAVHQEHCLRQIPLGRPGRPEDVAKAVLFLASPDADYITGEIMDVDGGVMMD